MPSRHLNVDIMLHGDTIELGQAWFTQRRRQEVTTVFAYDTSYIARPGAIAIDPALPLVTGNQYVDTLPGAFADCAPDRWGRNLVNKRRRLEPTDGRQPEVNEVDYLAGVSDRTRQGALRFREHGASFFLHPDDDVPKLIDLPRLVAATDEVTTSDSALGALKTLLDVGSGSLGGARPKASVLNGDGQLMIAKFPHQHDDWNVMAWECLALDLADLAGISVPRRELVPLADGRNVLLINRFDRTPSEHRIPYMSGMTLLGAADGERHDYIEVADHLGDISAAARDDLLELYRRVVFSAAIHNTDDHLRNLGFLAAPGGWRLSPLFDINPSPDPQSGRVTGIAGATHIDDEPAGLKELAAACRINQETASKAHNMVAASIQQWRKLAGRRGISAKELKLFEEILDRHHA